MSSWHGSQLTYAFGIGGMMSFYGIVSVIVYMMPASTASYNDKIVIIALVLLTLPFALIIMFVTSRRQKKREAAEAAAQSAEAGEAAADGSAPAKLVTPAGSYPAIESGIQELVTFLKTSDLGSGGKDALYTLPWYLVAGPPRSGKSSLVISSNLDFKTLPSQRESEQRTIRPTPGVDWRVTSEGIFIDTAGRYQSEGADADEWNALLESIRKHRSARPIDGFILVVNGDKVLKQDERDSEQTAKVLRSRLDEALQRLKVRFPVYLVFSNADGIEGFSDSFSRSKNDGRELVWGATIPLAKSENAQSQFDPEFEILRDSAMKRRILRLSAPFEPVRQLKIFNFPLHFGSARRKIGSFIATLFRPNPFNENPMLRGFYFTAVSATRGGQNVPASVGTSYFTTRLFRDVFLRDKELVRVFQAQKQRGPVFGWLMAALGGLLLTLLLTFSTISLISNKQMLADAQGRGEKVIALTRTDAFKDPAKADENAIRTEVRTTEELRELLVKLDDYDRNGAPLYMRFGLYTGGRVYRKHLLPVYMSVIENRYKASAVKKIEDDLKKFSQSSPVVNPGKLTDPEEQNLGKNYDLLKAYLMLTGDYKERAESTHLANILKDYWATDKTFPSDLRNTALQQLDFWAKQVDRDDDDFRFPRIKQNDELVRSVRTKLQDYPAVNRYLKRKVTEISKTIDDTVGKTTVEAILSRNSADTGAAAFQATYAVPSAFTREGYELMKKAIAESGDKLGEDDWVMGDLARKQRSEADDNKRLTELYFRNYRDHWQSFVKGITVRPYNMNEAATSLVPFTTTSSPMKVLLAEVARNTHLSAKPEHPGLWAWIKSFFTSDEPDPALVNSEPEKDFKPLFAFVEAGKGGAIVPIEGYGAAIKTVATNLKGKSPDQLAVVAQKLAAGDENDGIMLSTSMKSIEGMIGDFNSTSSGQDIAVLLRQPLGNLKNLLGGDIQTQLKKVWAEQILPAAKEIEKGYPFEDGSSEADIVKLSAFLNPVDGKLSVFYEQRLKKYFEESNGQLKLKGDSEVKFSEDSVNYLNNAFALRKALFGTSQTAKFSYEFKFTSGKESIVEVTIDGQKTSSEGTSALSGSFPAPSGTESGVIMNSGTSGPASTSPPQSNTNSVTPTTGDSKCPRKCPGTWGLFRFVDAGSPTKASGNEYNLSYKVGQSTVSATIKANGGDLFDKNMFRSVRAPQNLTR